MMSNLQALQHTATTITLTWMASGPVDQYEIMYNYTINECSEAGSFSIVNVSDGSVMSHSLSDLNEDSSYTITVRAISTMGSITATVTTNTSTTGNYNCCVTFSTSVLARKDPHLT
jgi:hypothetical protein